MTKIGGGYKVTWILLGCISLLLLTGPGHGADNAPLKVYTVNYPLKYFAERIGGEHVEAILPVPRDVDPAFWNPGIAEVNNYQRADLILLNGAGYAKWVQKVSLPRARVVDTSKNFKDRFITGKEVLTHSHGAKGEHAHESLAFTTWLDFSLAARQAHAVALALVRQKPAAKTEFETNFKALLNDLEQLDQQLLAAVSARPAKPLVMSHPVYDYLIARYKLNAVSLHWEPEEEPGAAQMSDLSHILKTHPAQWMIWEGEPLAASVDKLAELGLSSRVFDPCGNEPGTGDFLSVMRQNINNLATIFK